jgi:hypothetical protein
MNFDISPLLEQWDYQPGEVAVRRFKAKDGTEKIQLRIDLGLLQMHAAGRPDGKRPLGRESLLEHYQTQLEKHRQTHNGSEEGFVLRAEDCSKLQQECIQYHHRYICLFQLEDFANVIRDTDRNLKVFEFVTRYAEAPEMAGGLDQFRPQLLMMNARARGMQALQAGNHSQAVDIIETCLATLRDHYRHYGRYDLLEQSGEIQSLEVWQKEILAKKPLSQLERLEHELAEAVRQENYEKAAQVRDALRNLKPSPQA